MNGKKIKIFLLFSVSIFTAVCVHGQDEEKKEGSASIPAGMKLKQEGDVGILMPKDGLLRRINGNIILMESTEEYTARQLLEMKRRLAETESALEEQKDEIKYLKRAFVEMRRAQKDDSRSGDIGTAITVSEKTEEP